MSGATAVRSGMRARRLLLGRRLAAELAQGRSRAFGLAALGIAIGVAVFAIAFAGGRYVMWRGAPELVRTGMSAGLLGLSAALILSSLGHAAQSFFSAKDLWFWDSTPVPPWARFCDRFVETAINAIPTTLSIGALALAGLALGGGLGVVGTLRALVAVVLIVCIPLSIGVMLAHIGGAILPAGKLRRVSLLILGVVVALALVWFRRARVERLLTPEGATEILNAARGTRQLGPALLPSSVGADFVVDGSALGLGALAGYSLIAVALAFVAHRTLSRRARDLAVDESPIGILRGSVRERLLKLAVRPAPKHLRPMIEKDLLAFARDPAQWGQVVLLLGVGALYLVNADALRQGFEGMPEIGAAVLPSMHTGLVCFISAGLGARFAFPQMGLEGPAVWIVDGSPLHPRDLMRAKWIASLPIVVLYPTVVAMLGGIVLDMDVPLFVITTTMCALLSAGIAAYGVGKGALKPLFDATSLSELAVGPHAISTMIYAVMLAFFGSVGTLLAGTAIAVAKVFQVPSIAGVVVAIIACGVPAWVTLRFGKSALDAGALAFVRRREDEATKAFLDRQEQLGFQADE